MLRCVLAATSHDVRWRRPPSEGSKSRESTCWSASAERSPTSSDARPVRDPCTRRTPPRLPTTRCQGAAGRPRRGDPTCHYFVLYPSGAVRPPAPPSRRPRLFTRCYVVPQPSRREGGPSCAEPPRHPARSSREQCSCRLLRSPRVGRSRGRASPRARGRTRLTVRSRFPTPVRESPFCVVGSQRSRARSCWPRTVRVVVSGPDIVVRTGPTSSGLSHLSVTLVRTGDDYVRDRPGGWLATHVEDDVSTLASYGLEDLLLVADTATSAWR